MIEGPNARDQIVFCALNSFLVEVQTKLACFRLSDSGEDAKVKGTRKVERYAKSWRGGAGRVGFHPFFFLMFALSQFSGPDYLRAWNRKNEAGYVRAVYV